MRTRLWSVLLLAIAGSSAVACFPEYAFDLAEGDEPDASVDEAGSTEAGDDVDAEADADGDAAVDSGADGEGDSGPDAEADGGEDAGPDAETDGAVDSGPDADGDSGADSGGDGGADADSGPPPPEPNCGEGAVGKEDYECIERPPPDWSGPVALYKDVYSLPVPACPALFFSTPLFNGHEQPSSTSAACSQCTCSGLTGVTCSAPTEEYFSGASCSGLCGWSGPSSQWDRCMGWAFEKTDGCPAPTSVKLGPSTPSGTPSCTPSVQAPNLPPAWIDRVRACHAPSSSLGCEGDFVCAPKGNDAYGQMCIFRIGEGDVACPSGPYSKKYVLYQSANDTRSCTDCQCGTASNVQCNTTLKTYSDSLGCMTEDASIAAGTCGNFPTAPLDPVEGKWVKAAKLTNQPTGTCPSSGGQPIGSVTPSGPAQTICCKP